MFVITGGGTGIGRALAEALALREKMVLIVGRRKSSLMETAAFSPLISFLVADVSTEEGREQIVTQLNERTSIEGIVHNAGILEPIEPLVTMSSSSWQQTLATNLNAPLFLTQSLFNKLKDGRVLHIGSGAAYFAAKGWSAYCVSKAALSMLTRCWQLESESAAFTSVMPGIVDTHMQCLARQSEFTDEEKREFFNTLHQEGRLLSPSTVALFLCWLLLDLDRAQFVAKEWDIYDKSHHKDWLKAPHEVPDWE